MKKRSKSKLNLLYILNDAMIIYNIYFIYAYIELTTKNQIQESNINLYIYLTLILLFNLIKRIERKTKAKNERDNKKVIY